MTPLEAALETARKAWKNTTRAKRALREERRRGITDPGELYSGLRAALDDLENARTVELTAWRTYDVRLREAPAAPIPPLADTKLLAIEWVLARRRVVQAEQAVVEARLEEATLHDKLPLELQQL